MDFFALYKPSRCINKLNSLKFEARLVLRLDWWIGNGKIFFEKKEDNTIIIDLHDEFIIILLRW